MKNIVNIINFVRGVEPRPGRNLDLVGTVRNQIEHLRKWHLPATFLLQYDAVIDKNYLDMLKDSEFEIGLWLEVVQPQVEAIGEAWQGRYPWDWYNDVGFLIGYTPEIRCRLIDEAMNKFYECLGYYPKSVGSWHIDAVSLKYLADKYKIDASCNCRDQVGTDGYTMQGAYYNQAYYPSVYNMFCPANSKETQINVPVFRMLGSDAVYAYDYQVKKDDYGVSRIPTLEPASFDYGGNPEWIDSFFENTFCQNGISFQYTQAGQENSFGWDRIGKGYIYQMQAIRQLADMGKVEVMTLGDSGRWYKENFDTTPAGALTCFDDCINNRYKAVWYYSKLYRLGLIWENGRVHIRDMYIFADRCEEHYLKKRCETHACEFRTPPVLDGVLYGKDSGVYFTDNKTDLIFDTLDYTEGTSSSTVTLKNDDGYLRLTMNEDNIALESDIPGLILDTRYDKAPVYGDTGGNDETFGNRNNSKTVITYIDSANVSERQMRFSFCNVAYGLTAVTGRFTKDYSIIPENGKIKICIDI